jgi:hypothetical protein
LECRYSIRNLQSERNKLAYSDNNRIWKSEDCTRSRKENDKGWITTSQNCWYNYCKAALNINNTLVIHNNNHNKPCHSFNQIKEYACTCYASSQLKIIAKYVWTYVISFGGTIYPSLPIIASRISLFVLTYLIVVSIPAANHNIYEPSMPPLIEASSNITVHYRNNICTITAVQMTLSYVIETTYSRGYRKMRGYCCSYSAPNYILPI